MMTRGYTFGLTGVVDNRYSLCDLTKTSKLRRWRIIDEWNGASMAEDQRRTSVIPATSANVSRPDSDAKSPTQPGAAVPSADVLRAVFESISSVLIVFDPGMQVIYRNEAARTLLPRADDVCAALSELTLDDAYQGWRHELRQVLDGRQTRRIDAVMRPAKDQPETYLHLVITPLREPASGEVLGGLLMADDVSSRISMEQRLAVSERLAAVGKLAARVAHELNNPLDGIMRYTNLAFRRVDESGDAKTREYLEQARAGLTRMAQITSALLEFSRTTHTRFEQATINKIAEDAVSAMVGRAQDNKVTVVCNFHKQDMPVVRGSSLFQVFCNLIKNAIDAMPDSGTLTLTTGIEGPDVIVTFEDTGIGLPSDVDKLFEPFYTTKASGKGTGLGLAVCKDIIERYSGSITAENRAEAGARMTVRVPVRNCAAVPASHRTTLDMGGD